MPGLNQKDAQILDAFAAAILPEGYGLPGGRATTVGEDLVRRSRTWDPVVAERFRWFLRAWDLGPLASRRLTAFHRLHPDDARRWVESWYSSRSGFRRMIASALKQIVMLTWASTPEVEEALGYDYRCRKDDVPRGAGRTIGGAATAQPAPPPPPDLARRGPAIRQGAVPLRLLQRDDARARPAEEMTFETRGWPDVRDGERIVADVVVVGSGAGGAVAATVLAEAGLSVAVLEEGDRVSADDFAGPMFDRFQRFCREGGMTQVWGNPPIPLPLGRVVGGTTVVNSGTCFRAPHRVLARWEREFGVDTAAMDPHYEEIEDFLSVRPVPWELLGPNGMAAHRGAVALGYSGGPILRNITDCHGCGQCAFGCPTNAKQAMHVSYIPRAHRAGARIFTGTRVDRIRLDDGGATGVEGVLLDRARRARGRFVVDASHVVVSAGAVYTPALLSASGVPDPSGQTGRNLRIHPATGVGGFFDDDVVNWKGTLQSYYIDSFFDTHELMFEATTTIPSIGAGSLPGIGSRVVQEMTQFRKLATLGFYVSDTSRGRVRTLSSGQPLATYRLNDVDARRMSIGIAVGAEVLLEAGASRVYPGIPGIDAISAREDIVQLKERHLRPDQLRLTAFHPMGTVRMGGDPARAVVDAYGRHHALDRLVVADASTFPTCVGVNPQMTIMAFAKRAAEKLVSTMGGAQHAS